MSRIRSHIGVQETNLKSRTGSVEKKREVSSFVSFGITDALDAGEEGPIFFDLHGLHMISKHMDP
jgi:hypothetical protein